MKSTFKIIVLLVINTSTVFAQDSGLVTDIDGNNYTTIKIGNQVWMAENLRVAHFNNGDTIPTTSSFDLDITNEAEPTYQWFYHEGNMTFPEYGRLYTAYVITDERNVCPAGWHVPSKAEWKTLIASTGKIEMENSITGIASKSGDKLKESGSDHWISPVSKATNKSGFTALPGGSRFSNGKFYHLGITANFWSSSINNKNYWVFRISNDTGDVIWYNEDISGIGYSIRCIRD